MKITICPPAHSNLKFDEYQFNKLTMPVSKANFDADGNAYTLKAVAFEDRLSITSHKLNASRRHPIPIWATNDSLLRSLLILFTERRAFIGSGRRVVEWPNGDGRARLDAAQQHLEQSIPRLEAAMKKACGEFVRCADPHRKAQLAKAISGWDTQLMLIKRPGGLAGTVLRIVYNYFRQGQSSAECAEALHLKPTHCRQLLRRLHLCWAKIQKMDKKPTAHPKDEPPIAH
jgi:hypothetical protein